MRQIIAIIRFRKSKLFAKYGNGLAQCEVIYPSHFGILEASDFGDDVREQSMDHMRRILQRHSEWCMGAKLTIIG